MHCLHSELHTKEVEQSQFFFRETPGNRAIENNISFVIIFFFSIIQNVT